MHDGTEYPRPRSRVVCNDGYSVSIQANNRVYRCPRIDHSDYYSEVELGFPNWEDDLINNYAEESLAPTATVYPFVPVTVVDQLLEKHGGIDHYN